MLERLLSPTTETLTSKEAVTNEKWSVKRDATVRLGPDASQRSLLIECTGAVADCRSVIAP